MVRQSPVVVHGVPFKKNPRAGQKACIDKAVEKVDAGKSGLNIKLPTGYGKTFTAMGIFSVLKHLGVVDNMLVIVPTRAQRDQYRKDGRSDAVDAGMADARPVVDAQYHGAIAIKMLRQGSSMFVTTVHAMQYSGGAEIAQELLSSGRWLIVVDEFHHYGTDKAWGEIIESLPYAFRLAMSATPKRANGDDLFGDVDVSVKYRDAAKAGHVKEMRGHAYVYRVDAIGKDGEIKSWTTSEIVKDAGSSDPEAIEQMMISNQMRWSPKYISPLVSVPIERMSRQRVDTGHKLQVLIDAFCVSHARLICEQVRAMFPQFIVEWVGTGTDDRTAAENDAILSRFCPPKDDQGRRPSAEIDVLVHVGIVAEGVDTVNVSEVVHCGPATRSNTGKQKRGRAARWLSGVVANISFDSSSELYPDYVGSSIMDEMDDEAPQGESKEEAESQDEREWDNWEMPEEPAIQIYDMEHIEIDSGVLEDMRKGAEMYASHEFAIDSMTEERWQILGDAYKRMKQAEAEQFNEQSVVEQWHQQVKNATSSLAGKVIKFAKTQGRMEKSLLADVMRRINTRKKRECGAVVKDVATLKIHWNWLKSLDRQIKAEGVPTWLL